MSLDERIARRKLSDAVFDRLSALIVEGELAAGDPLPSERTLMDRFGVGRPAIREAMQALSGLGLIQISHGERARVRALDPDTLLRQIDLPARLLLSASPDNLDHLKEARLLLERGTVRAAASAATPEAVATLRTLIDAQRASLAGFGERKALEGLGAFIGRDIAFHVAIAAIGGNPILVATSRAMLGWLRQYRLELLHWSGKESVTVAEHHEIADAIESRDPDLAEAAMTRHLARSSVLYVHRGADGASATDALSSSSGTTRPVDALR